MSLLVTAWVMTSVFIQYFVKFSDRMKNLGHKVFVLMDSASYHDAFLKPSNVGFVFLPPNTIKTASMDAGAINSLKCQYRKLHYRQAHNAYMHDKRVQEQTKIPKANISAIYKLDQLIATQFIEKAWSYVTKDTIANCWRHMKVLEQPVLDEYELGQQIIQANAEANPTTQQLFSVMYPDQSLEDIQFYDDDSVEMGTEEADQTLDCTVEQVFEE
ncbi:unnamed protein product [Rhizopus stolonifer]